MHQKDIHLSEAALPYDGSGLVLPLLKTSQWGNQWYRMYYGAPLETENDIRVIHYTVIT